MLQMYVMYFNTNQLALKYSIFYLVELVLVELEPVNLRAKLTFVKVESGELVDTLSNSVGMTFSQEYTLERENVFLKRLEFQTHEDNGDEDGDDDDIDNDNDAEV